MKPIRSRMRSRLAAVLALALATLGLVVVLGAPAANADDSQGEVTVSDTEVAAGSTTAVTVTGTGFDPSLATGTRPPFAGQPSGFYLAFGKFALTWKPSESAPGTARKLSTTDPLTMRWVLPDSSTPSVPFNETQTLQRATLEPDGTFSTVVHINKEQADLVNAETPGNSVYGIYTYAGGGATVAAYETFTPITFTSDTTLSGPTSVTYGTTPTYTATVPPAAGGTVNVTGVGAAQTVSVDASGTATFKVPSNLAVGSHTIEAHYSGAASGTSAWVTLEIAVTKAVTKTSAGVVMVKPAAAVKKVATTKATLAKAKTAAKAAKTKAAKKKAKKQVKKANKAAKKAAKALKKAKAVPYVKVTTAATTGGPAPTGRVTVTFTKGSARATATGNLSGGTVMVKVPKLAKGVWKATASYAGSASHTGSTARSVNVNITK